MTFRPATQADIDHIAANLRPEDQREMEVFTEDPKAELRRGWKSFPLVYSASVEGEPAVVMGVEPQVRDGSGRVWLLGTPKCEERPIALMKEARLWRDRWLDRWSPLWNVVDPRNEMHVRWIESIGFRLGNTVEINEHPFIYFSITRDDPCVDLPQ